MDILPVDILRAVLHRLASENDVESVLRFASTDKAAHALVRSMFYSRTDEPELFFVRVRPGEDVQAAVDRCPSGGAVLLEEGTHVSPAGIVLRTDARLFGRGLATLRTEILVADTVGNASIDGLTVTSDGENTITSRAQNRLTVRDCTIRARGCGIRVVQGHSTLACNRIEAGNAGVIVLSESTSSITHNRITHAGATRHSCIRMGIVINSYRRHVHHIRENEIRRFPTGIWLNGRWFTSYAADLATHAHCNTFVRVGRAVKR